MTYALGLDLGTTYTAAAICRGDRCEITPLGNRAAVVPSVVHLGPDGTTLVGEAAQRRATTDPSRVAREFKRRFGDPTPLLLGGSPIAAEALTARLAEAVVAAVAEREGARPDRITVTHPATWGPFKRDLLQQAMRMAHLRDVSFVSEPEAAAWEYAASRPLAPGSTIAVYDLGGGTFDATVLRAGPDGFELLGEPEGIERLGGIDIDQAVFAFVVEALDGAVEALDPDDPVALAALARLRADCVEAKEALSSDNETSIAVVLPTAQTEVRLTRPELEALIRPVMGDTVAAMRRALGSAGVTADELAAVLLVGGSSRIPLVGELVGQLLGRPVAVDAHPKHLVAMGAARHAAADGVLARLGGTSGAGTASGPIAVVPPAAAASIMSESVVAEPVVAPPASPAPVVSDPAPVPPVSDAAPAAPVPSVPPVSPVVAAAPAVPSAPTTVVPAAPTSVAPSAPSAAGGVPPHTGSPTSPGRRDADDRSAPPAARKRPVGLLVGAAAVVAALVVGAILVLGGGGGGGGGDDAAAGGNGGGADCPTSGPFVCITEVSRSSAGGLQASFRPVELQPTDPGSGGRSLVFFLADVVATDHGLTAVSNGAPIEWGATQPFQGWTSDQLAARSVVCALVVESGAVIVGSGNCRPLP